MTSHTATDYRNTYFEIKNPTPICGEPTYESLKLLHNEIKINAQSIPTQLGGGNNGHLGLVLTVSDYQLVTPVMYFRPVNPGLFQIDTNLDAESNALLRLQHQDRLNEYVQCTQIEAQLKQFIIEAITTDYLNSLRDPTTSKLVGSIPDIMQNLFQTYAKITPAKYQEKQKETTEYEYNASTPIDLLFNKIEEFNRYASAYGDTQSETTLITLAYNCLRRINVYNSYLEKWNDRPTTDHTWNNFKTYFREAWNKRKEFSDTTTAQAGYAQVNELTEQFANILREQQPSETETQEATAFLQQMSNAMTEQQQNTSTVNNAINMMQSNLTTIQEQVANLARGSQQQGRNTNNTTDNTANNNNNNNNNNSDQRNNNNNGYPYQNQPPMYAMPVGSNPPPMYQPQFQNSNGQQNFQTGYAGRNFIPGFNRGYSNRGRGNRGNNNAPPRNNFNRNNNNMNFNNNNNNNNNNNAQNRFYCWTHGACAHSSNQCLNQAFGHCAQATFRNRMNGNTRGVW